MKIAVCDLGGTNIRLGISPKPNALHSVQATPWRRGANLRVASPWESVIDVIDSYVSRQLATGELGPNSPLVVGYPGPIAKSGESMLAATVESGSKPSMHLRPSLELRLQRPVFMINDISAAAWHFSKACNPDERFFVITISSGIGAKMFDCHSQHVLDDVTYGGEIGHLKIPDFHGRIECECGGFNHLGSLASGRGIERFIREMAELDSTGFRGTYLAELCASDPKRINNEDHIVPAARNGCSWTLLQIAERTKLVANVLAPIIVGAGLHRVFIMGGFAAALGDAYLGILSREILNRLDFPGASDVDASRFSLVSGAVQPGLLGLTYYSDARGLYRD